MLVVLCPCFTRGRLCRCDFGIITPPQNLLADKKQILLACIFGLRQSSELIMDVVENAHPGHQKDSKSVSSPSLATNGVIQWLIHNLLQNSRSVKTIPGKLVQQFMSIYTLVGCCFQAREVKVVFIASQVSQFSTHNETGLTKIAS